MQPGSESKNAIEFCEKNNIKAIYGLCVMTQRRKGELK